LICLVCVGLNTPCFALEFEPRRWAHLPMGTNFAGVGYAYTEADILVNPATRLENVEMKLHTAAAKYIRTFELFDKSARIDVGQAYQEGDWTGLVVVGHYGTIRHQPVRCSAFKWQGVCSVSFQGGC